MFSTHASCSFVQVAGLCLPYPLFYLFLLVFLLASSCGKLPPAIFSLPLFVSVSFSLVFKVSVRIVAVLYSRLTVFLHLPHFLLQYLFLSPWPLFIFIASYPMLLSSYLSLSSHPHLPAYFYARPIPTSSFPSVSCVYFPFHVCSISLSFFPSLHLL